MPPFPVLKVCTVPGTAKSVRRVSDDCNRATAAYVPALKHGQYLGFAAYSHGDKAAAAAGGWDVAGERGKKSREGGGAKRDEQEQDTIKAKNVTTKRRREEEATDRDANEAENVPGETIFEEIGRNDGDEGPDRADPVQDQSSLDYELPQRVVVPVRQTPSQSDRVERWRCFAMCQGLSGAWTEGPKEQPAILRALQRRGL